MSPTPSPPFHPHPQPHHLPHALVHFQLDLWKIGKECTSKSFISKHVAQTNSEIRTGFLQKPLNISPQLLCILFRWFQFILIASCMANYDWPFGTLSSGLFCSNLDTRDLETYPRTYSGHFWNMSLFDNFRAIWVLFRKWVVSENCILLRNWWPTPGYSDLVLGGEVPRLNHGPICFPIQNT